MHMHGTRKFLFRRFPYQVIYRIIESTIQVIAVASRTPSSRILEVATILEKMNS